MTTPTPASTPPEQSGETTVISVAGEQPYDITIGRGILPLVGEALPEASRKVLVVHPPTLAAQAAELRMLLQESGERQVLLAEIPDAETGKRVEVAAFCWQVMGQADFTRTDVVVGFGGGAVTDLAGFVAATWLRGVAVVQVPTTVLGMVDAAVGGKTGINTNEGKNLVGAFWPPRAVICDLALLDTLSRNERVAGFAEVVKAGFIWYPEILDLIEADPEAAVDPQSAAFRRCIELAIQMKARVVGEDLREAGLREVLNYGHTLGHAIEHAERYQWRHGAAISVGMMFAAELLASGWTALGCRGAAPPRHPGAAGAADELPRRGLPAAARDDAARQEDSRLDAALHRARRDRQADGAAGSRRVAAVRRVSGDRGLTGLFAGAGARGGRLVGRCSSRSRGSLTWSPAARSRSAPPWRWSCSSSGPSRSRWWRRTARAQLSTSPEAARRWACATPLDV